MEDNVVIYSFDILVVFNILLFRPSVVENGGQSFINPCLENNTGLHEKAEAMHIDASKDSLTEVGAARILADLSTKQNFSTQFDQAHTILTAANI